MASAVLARALIGCGSHAVPPGSGAPSGATETASAATATPTSATPSPPTTARAETTGATVATGETGLPGARVGAPQDGPAFAITFRRTEMLGPQRATVLLPFAASRPARSLPAVVVLDDAVEPPALRWIVEPSDHPFPCRCACTGACPLDPRRPLVLAIDGADGALAPACGCYAASDAPSCDPPAGDREADAEEEGWGEEQGWGEEEAEEGECEGAAGTPATIVGGRLFVPVDIYDGCGGMNAYGGDLETIAITARAWAPPRLPDGDVTCSDSPVGSWATIDRGPASPDCRRSRRGFRGGRAGFDCASCTEDPDGVVPRITRGRLHLVGSHVEPVGAVTRWDADVALSPASCPSAADPCGDPQGFPALASLAPSADFWIATDGEHALVLLDEGHGAGRLEVYARGADAPVHELVVPFTAGDVLGVRVHREARPLAALADRGLPSIDAPRECAARGTATGPGAPTGTPTTSAGPGGSRALAPAAAASACAPGERAIGSRCAPIPLAPADEGVRDTRGGSDWGNRCAVHLREGRLDAAEAACARGLAMATRDTTRGAIDYNLGRIAEARGDRATARRFYVRSLEVRPGNAAVQRALDALGPGF